MFMSYFVPFRSKSWPKVENDQKWSWFELCSKWLQIGPNSDIKSYFSHFIEKFDQKWKMVKNEVCSNFAPKNKSDIVIFCPISTKQLTKSGKWLKVKLVRTLLQMGPNSHIKSYFVPFQPKSWPKVENGQKWSRFEHCSKWLQIGCYFVQNNITQVKPHSSPPHNLNGQLLICTMVLVTLCIGFKEDLLPARKCWVPGVGYKLYLWSFYHIGQTNTTGCQSMYVSQCLLTYFMVLLQKGGNY